MIGAITGDVVGSVYEFDNIKTKEFELFKKECFFTDDTVMTAAIAEVFLEYDKADGEDVLKAMVVNNMHRYGELYPYCGFGSRFRVWVREKMTMPYNSYGNGSAMRVSPVIWVAESLEEAENLAKLTAEVTHNHPEGIKGAVVTAGSGFLAKSGEGKEAIKKYIQGYYNIDFTLDGIREIYEFNETCQETVPQAMVAFLEAESFEDAIRNAISIGGDSDTLAAITGAVAEAYYGIDKDIKSSALSYLDKRLFDIVESFEEKYLI